MLDIFKCLGAGFRGTISEGTILSTSLKFFKNRIILAASGMMVEWLLVTLGPASSPFLGIWI